MKYLLTITFLLISYTFLFSQTDKDIFSDIVVNKSGQGTVSIVQSSSIKKLVNTHVEGVALKQGISGFRIQVYSGSSRSAKKNALQIISSFRSEFRDIEPHLSYDEPNFKVRVGDFRTKSDALRALQDVIKHYQSAFIIRDYVDFPKVY